MKFKERYHTMCSRRIAKFFLNKDGTLHYVGFEDNGLHYHYHKNDDTMEPSKEAFCGALEEAMYLLAQYSSKDFRSLYNCLKTNEPKLFPTAKKVLRKIKREFNFS